MNAILPMQAERDAPLSVVCDTRALTISVNRNVIRVSNDELVMVALLAKASPQSIPRDRMMKKIYAGKRIQKDPATCLRSLMKRVRSKLEPLGLAIIYTPNPNGSDLPGFYSLSKHTCALPRARKAL